MASNVTDGCDHINASSATKHVSRLRILCMLPWLQASATMYQLAYGHVQHSYMHAAGVNGDASLEGTDSHEKQIHPAAKTTTHRLEHPLTQCSHIVQLSLLIHSCSSWYRREHPGS